MSIRMLDQLERAGVINQLDRHFALLMGRLAKTTDPRLLLSAALVSQWRARGHVCLDLTSLRLEDLGEAPFLEELDLPDLSEDPQALREFLVVGDVNTDVPLILDDVGALYLNRYWRYENDIVEHVLQQADAAVPFDATPELRTMFDQLFPEASDDIDWQKVAAAVCLTQRFSVISGGPGTGKTTIVVKLLALILSQASKEIDVLLAAPTGKAAARMEEAIREGIDRLDCDPELKDRIPREASTLHRLLRFRPGSPQPYHGREHPLACDILIIDEASMVDLALMAKLLRALPEDARIILLGDRDQLASVEAGSVLGDLCQFDSTYGYNAEMVEEIQAMTGEALPLEKERTPSLRNGLVLLQKSHRFDADSGIGHLARALKEGGASQALKLLKESTYADLDWVELENAGLFQQRLKKLCEAEYTKLLKATTPEEAHRQLAERQLLCVTRKGAFGVEAVNRLVAECLGIPEFQTWYHGRPVMVLQNDYQHQLYNGDVGITLTDEDGELRVYFPDGENTFRAVLPGRLPPHETAFALTVHKSQGSQFEQVLLVLPEVAGPVLTRELLYTAVTRAKKSLQVWGKESILTAGTNCKVERYSGLRRRVWG